MGFFFVYFHRYGAKEMMISLIPIKQAGIYPQRQIIWSNPPIAEVPVPLVPQVHRDAVIGAGSAVIGGVSIAEGVFVGMNVLIRADASPPFYIGPRSNLQDFVSIHCHPGEYAEVEGKQYGVYIEGNVSIQQHSAPHGPLIIGEGTFVGQHCSIANATIGRNCVIQHGAVITGKVVIPDNRFIAPGQTVWKQSQADLLPPVPSRYRGLNTQIADYYYRLGITYRRTTPLFV